MWFSVTGKGASESPGRRAHDLISIFKRPLTLGLGLLWENRRWGSSGAGRPRKREREREKVTYIQVVAREATKGRDRFRKWV